jgi:hypothetical protein
MHMHMHTHTHTHAHARVHFTIVLDVVLNAHYMTCADFVSLASACRATRTILKHSTFVQTFIDAYKRVHHVLRKLESTPLKRSTASRYCYFEDADDFVYDDEFWDEMRFGLLCPVQMAVYFAHFMKTYCCSTRIENYESHWCCGVSPATLMVLVVPSMSGAVVMPSSPCPSSIKLLSFATNFFTYETRVVLYDDYRTGPAASASDRIHCDAVRDILFESRARHLDADIATRAVQKYFKL